MNLISDDSLSLVYEDDLTARKKAVQIIVTSVNPSSGETPRVVRISGVFSVVEVTEDGVSSFQL